MHPMHSLKVKSCTLQYRQHCPVQQADCPADPVGYGYVTWGSDLCEVPALVMCWLRVERLLVLTTLNHTPLDRLQTPALN